MISPRLRRDLPFPVARHRDCRTVERCLNGKDWPRPAKGEIVAFIGHVEGQERDTDCEYAHDDGRESEPVVPRSAFGHRRSGRAVRCSVCSGRVLFGHRYSCDLNLWSIGLTYRSTASLPIVLVPQRRPRVRFLAAAAALHQQTPITVMKIADAHWTQE